MPSRSSFATMLLRARSCSTTGWTPFELSSLPLTAQVPVLLTRQEVRRPLRALLRSEFPEITVLSYGDLPPHYNVQPVARIS